MTEAVKQDTEKGGIHRLSYGLRDSGAHYHDPSTDNILIGGNHQHLLDDMKTIFDGGAHNHELSDEMIAGTQGQLGFGGEHVHFAFMPDGSKLITNPVAIPAVPAAGPTPANVAGGRHMHEVGPDLETSRGGQHVHTIQMPDGTVHKTLGHKEIKALIEKGEDIPSSIWDEVV